MEKPPSEINTKVSSDYTVVQKDMVYLQLTLSY